MKVLLVAGGTGGHLFPAIAVARKLLEIAPNTEIHFAIADNGQDAEILSHTPFLYTAFPVAKLRRYFSLENIRDFFRFFSNIGKAIKFLKKMHPQVVFSKGGFVSLPFGIAAKILGIPLLLHESDRTMGLSNRILAKIATKIFCGFPGTEFEYLGNPVRDDFFTIFPATEKKRPLLLVVGGSQGAQFLNEWTVKNAPQINEVANILLVSGKNYIHPSGVQNEHLSIVPFLHENFAETVHTADVVISRAGAGSISELAAAKKCTILIPLPSAANDHQRANARALSKSHAAIVWEQQGIEKEEQKNIDSLLSLLKTPEKRKVYEEKITLFAVKNAAEKLAQEILKMI